MYYTCTTVCVLHLRSSVYTTTLDVHVYVGIMCIHVLDVHVVFAWDFEECECRLL